MKKPAHYLLFIFSICCSTTSYKHISSFSDITKHEGKSVTVTGVYMKSKLAVKPDFSAFSGRYKLVVNDSIEIVILPPHDNASIRSKEEVEQFENKRVRITGTISTHTYLEKPSLDNSSQTVSIPCFTSVEKIEHTR